LVHFMRLSLLKGARAASSSAAWQEIRVPGWADVWLPALRAWIRFEVYFRVPTQTLTSRVTPSRPSGTQFGKGSFNADSEAPTHPTAEFPSSSYLLWHKEKQHHAYS
jgi:hypothetical protein